MILVDASGLGAYRPDRVLYSSLSLTVEHTDRVGVVGINGSGKSTLLRVLAGVAPPEEGEVRLGRGVRVGYLPQHPEVGPGTVRDAVGSGWRGEAALDRLGLGARLDADVATLSVGQVKRIALARLLASDHDLLVLDEPTNHLDLDAVAFLEDRLAERTGGLVLVTHDRHVLDRLTTEVLELDRGRTYLHVPRGEHAGSGYAAYLAARAEREERVAAAEDARRNLARRELAWLRRGAPARTRKPKARLDAARTAVERRAEPAARRGTLDLALGTARLGSKVIELHDVGFAYPDGPLVLEHVEHVVVPGDRLGLVGPNGAGKSTLLELLAGRRTPTVGHLDVGATVRVGFYDQTGAELDPARKVRDVVAGPHRQPDHEQARLMERFWFDGDAQWAEIGTLSGGERRRLQLLLVLVERPNVLLLDEPTNDLDLDTLRALEDFLDSWPGALVVASHDRTFLDRTVEEVLALDGRGGATLVRGGYAGWIAERERAAEASRRQVAELRRRDRSERDGGRLVAPIRSPSTWRRLLSQAERAVADARAERDRLHDELVAAGTDHHALARLGHALSAADKALAAAEERWLDLAAEAEDAGVEVG